MLRMASMVLPVVLLAGCEASSGDRGAAVTVDGATLYAQRCSACHQLRGQGLSGAFPPLAGSDWLRAATPAEIADLLLNGRTGTLTVNGVAYQGTMPPFIGQLDDVEIAAIANHVLTSWGNDGRQIEPALVAERRQAATR